MGFSLQINSQPIQANASNPTSFEGADFHETAGTFSKAKLVGADLDTAKLLSDQPLKSPLGAVLRSAVLPGWGQVYNQKYLKALFVFSVNGTFAYSIYHYNNEWRDTGNKKFQNKRNLYTWYFGVSYFLTLVDAFVDAYLFGFDKAVELALPIQEQSPGFVLADAYRHDGVQRDVIGLKISIEIKPGNLR